MANAAQTPKLQIGKLSPEDAERLASSFRPIWDLDDAPFAQGSALSAADIDALAGGAGVASSVRGTQQQAEPKTEITSPRLSLPGHVPAPNDPKVEIAVELDSAELVTATPAPIAQPVQVVAQAASQAAAQTMRKPYTPPRAPPAAINMREADASNELAPVKKSNTGIIIGGIAVVALVAGIFVVKAVMSGDKTQGSKTDTAQTNHEEGTHIPPPPEVGATQDTALREAKTTQVAPVVTAKPTNEPLITKEFPTTTAPPPATHVTAALPVHTTHVTSGGGAATHTATAGTTKPAGKPAIVRDNPF